MTDASDVQGAVQRVDVQVEEQQVLLDNVALRLVDGDGELMEIDEFSVEDGYVIFREQGESERTVVPDGAEATLSIREVPDAN